ncbi:thiamine phosphate synthase [Desulfovibrio mangrovi]|uniref:thiamine phosphate synthase n=1 Tax=Desulfovibrio mangrovi TaxID=2976983 RepID=UPI0022484B15|nr:thiamine phosphate synthase [Desulfovibrio mangrovi]UZP67819.1 thiamine phosphate synthase [Desulfovibrio mangrovi]
MQRILDTDIYALTDEGLSAGRSTIEVVDAMLKAGIKVLQYREKDKKAGAMLEECVVLRRMTREAGCTFIVNDHVDIAMLVDADGVHVGQEDIPVEDVRRLIGPGKIIGLSTHSPEQCRDAIARGADYIGVGPIFATKTKKDVCAPVGYDYLEYVVNNHDVPHVAIGGIKLHNVADVVRHGARCCALVSEIVGAADIGAMVARLRAEIASAR